MSHFDTLKTTLFVSTLTLGAAVGVAHATPEACQQDFTMDSYEENADTFGDDEFGGSYSMAAGLFEITTLVLQTPCSNWAYWNGRLGEHPAAANHLAMWETTIESIAATAAGVGNSLRAAADADITVFGHTQSVAEVSGRLGTSEASVYVEAMGQTLFDFDAMNAPLNAIMYVPLFGRSADIDLGIASISVGAELAGVIGITGSASANAGTGKLTALLTPIAALNISAEASVDLGAASAGVRGDLDVIRLEVPTEVSIRTNGKWSMQADAEATAIDGYLEAYVSALGQSADVTICEFDGFSLFDEELFSKSGRF